MKFEKAFEAYVAFLETFSVAMTAANSINPVVIFFRCKRVFFSQELYCLTCGKLSYAINCFMDLMNRRVAGTNDCEVKNLEYW
jgi:hypothetical protein